MNLRNMEKNSKHRDKKLKTELFFKISYELKESISDMQNSSMIFSISSILSLFLFEKLLHTYFSLFYWIAINITQIV